MSTRTAILSSWHAARRQADIRGAITLNAASFAGYALETANGDVELAHTFVPQELEVFWGRVHDALDQVSIEEGGRRIAVGDRS